MTSSIHSAHASAQAGRAIGESPDPSDQTIFLQQWGTYHKVVANNLMFHREAYGLLRAMLGSLGPQPLRVLDLGCGDAASFAALVGDVPIARYDGVDISAPALALATAALSNTSCVFALHHGDFAEALSAWREPVDVIWIGQSQHHLKNPEKQAVFADAHRLLRASHGKMLAIWEPTLADNEDREGWCDRFSGAREVWAALDDDEFERMASHVRASDHPESISDWLALGRNAGFPSAAELTVSAWALARFYRYDCAAG